MYLNFVNIIAENPQGIMPGYEVVPAIQMAGGYIRLNHAFGTGVRVLTRLMGDVLFGVENPTDSSIAGDVGRGWRIASPSWSPYYGTCQSGVWYDCEFVIARNGQPCRIFVDGTQVAYSGRISTASSQDIILFNRNGSMANYNTAFQRTKIYDMQDNLLFDLQPVVRLSDNAVGVYDYLSDTFIEAEGVMIPIYSL